MRVLFYIEHFRRIGGGENAAISLCKELKRRGYEIYVISRDGDEIEGIRLIKGFSKIREIAEKINPDISFDWGLFERADISRLGGGIHEVFLEYDLLSRPPILRPIIRWIYLNSKKHREKIKRQEYVLEKEDTIYIAPSNFIKEHALRYVPEERIRVIYNAVDLKRFSPAKREERISERRRWNIGDKEIVFLFVAHNLRLKNIGLLKKVFDKLYKRYKVIKLVVVGKRRPSFKRPYLIYTGEIADMPGIYRMADVLVHPSYFDTFGSVILEAMASGIPVISSKYTGSSEILEDSGIVLPVGDNVEKMWEDAIEKMMDEDIRKKMGERTRSISERYDLKSYTDKIEEIFQECSHSL